MVRRIWSTHAGVAAIMFGLLAGAIYFLMITVTLAHIEAMSGHIPFDMRPLGYGVPEAFSLLEDLGAEGRAYYSLFQIPLDTVYPALLALTLITTMRWFGQRTGRPKLLQAGSIVSAGAAVFDYLENIGIVTMISSWPVLSPAVVSATSAASIAKSVSTTLAVLLALTIGYLWLRQAKADFDR